MIDGDEGTQSEVGEELPETRKIEPTETPPKEKRKIENKR